ncbi:MAG: cytochrome C biogenesis protein [Betaproteobacteria bacterium RIFCSPLOWO2_12_FULL_62_13]|nr:MAG: cytochrome C biogenesis protein [Betaproteobacteria bacterium RIFCSPLOWO2_12_FULL_62_13]
MSRILPYLINALLYAGLAYHFWRTRWAHAAHAQAATSSSGALEHYAVLVPLGLHTVLLAQSVFGGHGLYLGVGNAISAILWLTVLIYWLANFVYKLEGLQSLVMPVAAVASLLPVVFPSLKPLPNTEFAVFRFHLLIAMLAYSLFTIASLHVLLMALLERRLHGGTLPQMLERLPPLLGMEILLFRIIWAGFILLTLTLASGVVFSEELFGQAAKFNHKTVFGVLSWIIFAALLAGRHVYGWRGRVAVRWTLAGFLALVLAYVGSRFVLEVILGRA